MERKDTQDPLEDYFRRTLDDHEAAPPADLWGRIEADLPPPAASPRSWWAVHRFAFVAGAIATLLLLALLDAAGRLYRQRATERTDVAQTPEQPATLTEKLAAPLPPVPLPRSGVQQPAAKALNHGSSPVNAGTYDRQQHALPAEYPAASRSKATPISPLPWHEHAAVLPPVHALQEAPAPAEKARNQAAPPAPQRPFSEASADVLLAEEAPLTGALAASGEPALPVRAIPSFVAMVDVRPALGTLLAPAPIRPARLPSGWSIGLYASCIQAPSATAPVAQSRFAQRVLFVSIPQPARPAWEGGLRVRKRIGLRWGLEAGLSYSEHVRNTAYISRFRFGDGRPTPGGGHAPRREYAHYLNTPGGTATVDFRMEPAKDSDPVPQGEIIRVRATFTEHTSLLRIPILASCSVGSGHLLGMARVGIVADIFLKNDLQITSFISENARVRLATGMRPSVQWTPARDMSFGYWLSAGVTYRLNRHIALSAEPVLTGRFSHRDAQGQPLPTPAAFGGQVGVWYGW